MFELAAEQDLNWKQEEKDEQKQLCLQKSVAKVEQERPNLKKKVKVSSLSLPQITITFKNLMQRIFNSSDLAPKHKYFQLFLNVLTAQAPSLTSRNSLVLSVQNLAHLSISHFLAIHICPDYSAVPP